MDAYGKIFSISAVLPKGTKFDDVLSRSLWGAAEMVSTKFGLDIAAWFHIKALRGGNTFVFLGNIYREILKAAKKIEAAVISIVTEPCNLLPGKNGGRHWWDDAKTSCFEDGTEMAKNAVKNFFQSVSSSKITEAAANILWDLGIDYERYGPQGLPASIIKNLAKQFFQCRNIVNLLCVRFAWD